jgi:succinate dehydrogenase / fumarate reductase flavoprotein subunit
MQIIYFLRLDHLGPEVVHKRLPGITELSKTFAGVDPAVQPIPVVPTCHYMMGGIPTNINGQVISVENGDDKIVDGLICCRRSGLCFSSRWQQARWEFSI